MASSRPRADRTNPGAYQQMTRETHPHLFRAPGTEAATQAQAISRLEAMLQFAIDGGVARTAEDDEAGEDDEFDQDYEDSDSVDTTVNPAPATAVSQARAQALEVNDGGWRKNQPKAQPLTYAIPTDAQGGVRYHSVTFQVDFTDAKSVEKANKHRRQSLYRAGKDLGLPLKRPSMKGKEYTRANDDWIIAKYDSYAAANGGKCISNAELYKAYNQHFSYRTSTSISSHVNHVDRLRENKERILGKR